MIVDSSALLAILFREPEAAEFTAATMQAPQPRLSAASYVEVSLRLDGALRTGQDDRLDAALTTLGLEIAPVTADQARLARRAFGMFGRGRHPAALNFGDCLTYALAKATGQPLLYKGLDFARTDLLHAIPPRYPNA